MDSIVDSFFPFLDEIEKEVLSIEDLVFTDESTMDALGSSISKSESRSSSSDTAVQSSSASGSASSSSNDNEKPGSDSLVEKPDPITEYSPHSHYPPRTHFALPSYPVFSWRRLKHSLRNLRTALTRVDVRVKRPQNANVASSTIARVSRMRRLVTSLARVLATKSEVVASVKKRLLMSGESGLGNGSVDDQDVFVYMGDVQGESLIPSLFSVVFQVALFHTVSAHFPVPVHAPVYYHPRADTSSPSSVQTTSSRCSSRSRTTSAC